MDTAGRTLKLLTLLQTRPRWGGDELAERLGTTTRTVRRDIVRLRELGYPVDADPGVAGGYRLGIGGRLPPLLLDDEEAVAVAVGLRVATGVAVLGVEDAVVAALAKLEGVLPSRLRERVSAVQAGTVQMQGPAVPRIDPDTLVIVADGCRRSESLRFDYRDHHGNQSRRAVEPYRVVHTGRRWYLVARDPAGDAWRTFRVDRISEAVLTGRHHTFADPPDPVALVADGAGVAPWDIEARIFVHAPPDEVRQVVAPIMGVVEPSGGGEAIVRVAANHLSPLVSFVCDLPFEHQVLDPPELAARVAALGARLLRSAGGPEVEWR